MIIKKIFEGIYDEEVHSDFLKFGRGDYKNKYLAECKKQKEQWVIKTSNEFANFLVRKCLENECSKIKMSGCIVSTFDLSKEISFEIEKIKNFMGVRQIIINSAEIEPKEILDLMDKYPRIFFGLSFKTSKCELKIRAKAPKSAKPSTKGEAEAKPDFCLLKTSDKDLINELFFDKKDWKDIKAKHTIKIINIIYPKDEKDPKIIRENSKRKGILIRELEIDGKKEIYEKGFIV